MQKWEYCTLVRISAKGRQPITNWPALWNFTSSGLKIIKRKGNEIENIAKTVAVLGEEGW